MNKKAKINAIVKLFGVVASIAPLMASTAMAQPNAEKHVNTAIRVGNEHRNFRIGTTPVTAPVQLAAIRVGNEHRNFRIGTAPVTAPVQLAAIRVGNEHRNFRIGTAPVTTPSLLG
ncbi:hypothetical protein A0U90_01660 [Kozakia baliensis]|nr:hypothetical protein A0U90_01660 [Kozakia baliensis]